MNAADRRTVHKLAGEHGIETESIGEGRDRHIILKPGSDVIADVELQPEITDLEPETKD